MQLGGSSKDTWITSTTPVEEDTLLPAPGKNIVIDEEDAIEACSADTGVTGARRSAVGERDD